MRLIDADELKNHMFVGLVRVDEQTDAYRLGWNEAIEAMMDCTPTVERPKGEWIDSDPDSWECSCCNHHVPRLYDYCPFCGAEMEVDNVRTDDHSPDL